MNTTADLTLFRADKARKAYLDQQTRGASPQDLIRLLLDGLHQKLVAGKNSLEEKHWQDAALELGKARKIVTYLSSTLQPEGGDITLQLSRLYAFCHEQIARANLEKKADLIPPVLGVVMELREAWNCLGNVPTETQEK
ncbi:MAG: flagellar export chaperone FliS [Candidatus Krumholzibacteria bacterium]|jgi:flagellar protein FliS|nr:flagellar export chaperone FliS [Candidatus Krumholzibacteria bacterium]MDP6669029.1 flagellar export chaperone FliS [Candidatus Krumholzibacteria bacterium]MDP6796307.1 flagellar export chaperone FliS [Candidatus Krumholzibacteria bacterium]MDP7020968.1 flagellar export chaperone FliS [Candidatus Krumholzibacteria bacterium]